MNPGGDYGKRELSPALRNRLVEIWCPSIASKDDLIAIMEMHIGIEATKDINEAVLAFVKWYDDQHVSGKVPFTIRDLVAWMTFIKDTFSSIGESYHSYESFDHKRALAKYQSQSKVIKVML